MRSWNVVDNVRCRLAMCVSNEKSVMSTCACRNASTTDKYTRLSLQCVCVCACTVVRNNIEELNNKSS